MVLKIDAYYITNIYKKLSVKVIFTTVVFLIKKLQNTKWLKTTDQNSKDCRALEILCLQRDA